VAKCSLLSLNFLQDKLFAVNCSLQLLGFPGEGASNMSAMLHSLYPCHIHAVID